MCFVNVFALEFSTYLRICSLSNQQIICGTKLMKLQIESGLNFQQGKKKHHKSTHLNQKHTRCSNNFPFLNIISLKFDFWANNKLFNRYSTIQWFCCLAIWRNFCAFLVERVFMSFSNLILFSRRTKSRNFANNIFQRILLAFFFLFHTNFCISKCVLSHFVPKNKKTEWQNHFSDFNGASHFLFLFCEKAILHFD